MITLIPRQSASTGWQVATPVMAVLATMIAGGLLFAMLGLALAQAWLDQGRPAPFTLAEIGPGRGTLMADLLRATVAAR